MSFLQNIIDTVDLRLADYTMKAYQGIVDNHQAAIYALVTLYVVLIGYRYLLGAKDIDFNDLGKRLVIMAICVLFATNWGWFSEIVYHFTTNGPESIAVAMVSAVPEIPSGQSGIGLLEFFWEAGLTIASQVASVAGKFGFFQYLMSAVVYLIATLATLVAVFMIIGAKMTLAVCLALAPVFILLFLFDSTRGLFDGWLKIVLEAMLMPLFVYAVIALVYVVMHGYVDDTLNQQTYAASDLFALIFILAISGTLYFKAGKMAAQAASSMQSAIAPPGAGITAASKAWAHGKASQAMGLVGAGSRYSWRALGQGASTLRRKMGGGSDKPMEGA